MDTRGFPIHVTDPIQKRWRNMKLCSYPKPNALPLFEDFPTTKTNKNFPLVRRYDEDLHNELPEKVLEKKCGKLYDRWATTYQRQYRPPSKWINGPVNPQTVDVHHHAWEVLRYFGAKEELRDSRLYWHNFLKRCPEKFSEEIPAAYHSDPEKLRYRDPYLTKRYRPHFKPQPCLEKYTKTWYPFE